jgi:hypothetical protein
VARFVVRYRGLGERPREAVKRIQSIPGAKILGDAGKMMLVEAPESELRTAMAAHPDWVVAPESTYDVPDPRKRIEHPPT